MASNWMIRVLSSADRALITEALSWTSTQPRWLQDGERVWGEITVDEYLRQMSNDPQVDYGVFDGGALRGIITVVEVVKRVYNVHIMARRHADPALLIWAGKEILTKFRELGLELTTAWPMRRNRGMRAILEAIGYRHDGMVRIKGHTHGQLIDWLRYVA